jgi:hypothetical protein
MDVHERFHAPIGDSRHTMVRNGYQAVEMSAAEVVLQDVGPSTDFGMICDFLSQAAKTAQLQSSRKGVAVRAQVAGFGRRCRG